MPAASRLIGTPAWRDAGHCSREHGRYDHPLAPPPPSALPTTGICAHATLAYAGLRTSEEEAGASGPQWRAAAAWRPSSARADGSALRGALHATSAPGNSLGVVGAQAATVARASVALRSVPLFRDLGEIELSMLAASAQPCRVSRYSELYREGARCTCFYLLCKGRLQLDARASDGSRASCSILECDGGAGSKGPVFGLEPLMASRRAASASALEGCELLRFSASMVQKPEGTPASLGGPSNLVSSSVYQAYIGAEMRAMPLFAGVGVSQMEEVTRLFSLQARSPFASLVHLPRRTPIPSCTSSASYLACRRSTSRAHSTASHKC